eukprot:s6142_g5.t1
MNVDVLGTRLQVSLRSEVAVIKTFPFGFRTPKLFACSFTGLTVLSIFVPDKPITQEMSLELEYRNTFITVQEEPMVQLKRRASSVGQAPATCWGVVRVLRFCLQPFSVEGLAEWGLSFPVQLASHKSSGSRDAGDS